MRRSRAIMNTSDMRGMIVGGLDAVSRVGCRGRRGDPVAQQPAAETLGQRGLSLAEDVLPLLGLVALIKRFSFRNGRTADYLLTAE